MGIDDYGVNETKGGVSLAGSDCQPSVSARRACLLGDEDFSFA